MRKAYHRRTGSQGHILERSGSDLFSEFLFESLAGAERPLQQNRCSASVPAGF